MDLLFSTLYLFIFCLQIPEGEPVLLILDEDVREYGNAVQKCQKSNSGSLWDPKTLKSYENILRNNIHVSFWIGIQQFRSKFVSHEGCISKESFTETSHHMSDFASIGYCSTFCKENDSLYFHYKTFNSCTCLKLKLDTKGSRCSFSCSSDACKDTQNIDTYFTVDTIFTEGGSSSCMVVNCNIAKIDYEPKPCSTNAGGACDNSTYIDEQKPQRNMTRKCDQKNRPLSSINDKLCDVGNVKDKTYWINPERRVYEAPNDHTGGDAMNCRGMYLNYTKESSQLEVGSCGDKYVHVCVVDDGFKNITLKLSSSLLVSEGTGVKHITSTTSRVSDQQFMNNTKSTDGATIWGSILGTITVLTGCTVGMVVYYRKRRKTSKNDGTDIKENTSDANPNINYFVLEAKAAHRESTVKNNTNYDNAYQHCDLASSSAKVSVNEESVYAEQPDDVYDELNKRRRVNRTTHNQNENVYSENMVDTVADNGVYNTLHSTIQNTDIPVPKTIEESEGYGHLQMDGLKKSTDSNYDHCCYPQSISVLSVDVPRI